MHVEAITNNNASDAFNKQAEHFDSLDQINPTLTAWRQQVYRHVDSFLPKESRILELNAGTGIDALRFAKLGHTVHATDVAVEMIKQIERKALKSGLARLTFEQCGFDTIGSIRQTDFNFVFSNFGGLNCEADLCKVAFQLRGLIKNGSFITLVVMPPLSLWELSWVFKGSKKAFRRLKKGGALAHVEGTYFKTYYHSLQSIKKAFAPDFKLMIAEGLGALSPPPSADNFIRNYPRLTTTLNGLDKLVRNKFPFNRWADHLIATLKFEGK